MFLTPGMQQSDSSLAINRSSFPSLQFNPKPKHRKSLFGENMLCENAHIVLKCEDHIKPGCV